MVLHRVEAESRELVGEELYRLHLYASVVDEDVRYIRMQM